MLAPGLQLMELLPSWFFSAYEVAKEHDAGRIHPMTNNHSYRTDDVMCSTLKTELIYHYSTRTRMLSYYGSHENKNYINEGLYKS